MYEEGRIHPAILDKMIFYVVLFAFSCALVLPAFRLSLLSLLCSSDRRTELTFSPNDLRLRQIVLVILVLSTKALQQLLGLVPKLSVRKASEGSPAEYILPALRLRAPIIIKPVDVRRYEVALNIAVLAPNNPAHHNMIFLAGITTPLMLLILAKRSSPMLPLGSVNVRNKFEFLNPRLCHDAARGLLKGLGAEARLTSPGRRTKRGIEFDVVIEVTTGKVDLVKEQIVFRQTITLLQFLAPNVEPKYVEEEAFAKSARKISDGDVSTYDVVDQKLDLDIDAPLVWAAFCKDFNPIHVSSGAAKAFGFPGQIAHGNLVACQAMVVLAGTAGPRFEKLWSPESRPSWLKVEFKRPMVVPTSLDIFIDETDERNVVVSHFKVTKHSKVYIDGKAGLL